MNNDNDKNYEGRFRIIKKEYKKLNRKYTRETIMSFTLLCLFTISVGIIVIQSITNKLLTEDNIFLHNENMKMTAQIDAYMDTALYFADMSIAMDDTNASLKEIVSNQEEELIAYREREELYDKYEWSLYYSGKRTDITYEQIESLQEYCDSRGYSSEMVDLVLAVAMKESTGNEKAYNASSGASGYCQLLGSTARMVYTKLQDNEEPYTHDVALDGEKNLQLAADYLQYLYEYHGNNPIKMIDSYRGMHSIDYINSIDNYLKKNDLSIYNLDLTKEE